MSQSTRSLLTDGSWDPILRSATRVVPPAGDYLVVAPHPDDESLTVGGLVSCLCRTGSRVTALCVTDGGNAYPTVVDHDTLATARMQEQAAAFELLGVEKSHVRRLGIIDGHVAERVEYLTEAIASESDATTTIVAPWTGDVHPDHEAVGRAARDAADRIGCTVWFSLFWAWHRLRPALLADVPLLRIDVSPTDRERKMRAIGAHRTQLSSQEADPILDDELLEPACWDAEYFIPYVGTPS